MMDARAIIGSVNKPDGRNVLPRSLPAVRQQCRRGSSRPGPTSPTMNLVAAGWTPRCNAASCAQPSISPPKYTSRVVVCLAINPTIFPTEVVPGSGVHGRSTRTSHPSSVARWGGELLGPDELHDRHRELPNHVRRDLRPPCWRSIQLARAHRVADTQNGDTATGWPEVAMWWANLGGHAVETLGQLSPAAPPTAGPPASRTASPT